MILGDTTLIPQNVVPDGTRKVSVFTEDGTHVGDCNFDNLKLPELGKKLYSVGVLSDTHTVTIGSNTEECVDSQNDLVRAIRYLSNKVDMTCVCGDLVSYYDDWDAVEFHRATIRDNKGKMTVLEVSGNHESYSRLDKAVPVTDDYMKDMTDYLDDGNGNPICYTYLKESVVDGKTVTDVYLMCGTVNWAAQFNNTTWTWFTQQLTKYKNNRVFLFAHAFIKEPGADKRDVSKYCGDATGIIGTHLVMGSTTQAFINLMANYPNVLYFHGHSHVMLEMQEYTQSLNPPLPNNYDYELGCHSIHIPSLSRPRSITNGRVEEISESEGYIMDVYENHVVLKGMDFTSGQQIPIATYCLETKHSST